jgi:hypothetical protein
MPVAPKVNVFGDGYRDSMASYSPRQVTDTMSFAPRSAVVEGGASGASRWVDLGPPEETVDGSHAGHPGHRTGANQELNSFHLAGTQADMHTHAQERRTGVGADETARPRGRSEMLGCVFRKLSSDQQLYAQYTAEVRNGLPNNTLLLAETSADQRTPTTDPH